MRLHQNDHLRTAVTAVLLSAALLLVPGPAPAEDYAFQSAVFNTYNYISASTGGTALDLGDDAVSAPIDIGFTFQFYDSSYTQVIVGSNGVIGFPGDTTSLDTATLLPAIPDGAAPNAVIAPLSSDLDPSGGGSIYTFSGGTSGERYFVVEWIGVPVKGEGGSRTFEAVLFEDNSDILFQYQVLRGGQILNGTTTNVGVEKDGTAGLSLNNADLALLDEGKSVLFSVSNPDSDGDSMLDRFEDFYGLTDAAADQDADGSTNLQEFNDGTRPNQADTDGDGIEDGNDTVYPLDVDGDEDGIQDGNEDLNKDGVVDAGETDPASFDSDGDGYNDGMEITYQKDPLDASSVPSLPGYTKVSTSIQAAINAASTGDILYIPSAPAPYTESLTINKAMTLVGADPDTTLLEGDVTIQAGVEGVVLTGFTIQGAATAVTILGHASQATAVHLVNMTLKNCTNGVLVSDLSGSGGATQTVLDQVRFTVTQPMQVGYGLRVEGLKDAADSVTLKNSSISLTGAAGAVVVQDARDVTVSGNTISSAYGDAVSVAGNSSGVSVSRNTFASNGGNGILISDTASADITDNAISSNKGYGIAKDSTGTVTNSGNAISSNGSGSYGGSQSSSLDQSETVAAVVGAALTGRIIGESAVWVTAASGGTVALINPSDVVTDPLFSLFGTSITLGANTLSTDAFVTVSTSWESLPALPIAYTFAMPTAEISLESGALNGSATITLPVLASYSVTRARVFHLVNGAWQEISLAAQSNYGKTFLHQQVSFPVDSLGSFVLVLDLPIVDPGDTGGGGGCGLQKGPVSREKGEVALDAIPLLLPVFFLIAEKRKIRRVTLSKVQE